MPDGISNVDSTILKLAEQYQSTLVRSRDLNDERKVIRENVDKLGIDPKAFQVALMMTRDMTSGERQDYTGSLNRVIGVLDGKEADLFGADEVAKRDKRAQRKADKAAKAAGTSTDDNPRSDPKKGGAGGAKGRGKAKDSTKPAQARGRGRGGAAVQAPPADADNVVTLKDHNKRSAAAIAETEASILADKNKPAGEGEQAEGDAVLNAGLTETHAAQADAVNSGENGAPKSQSQQSAEALERAGLTTGRV
jgi:hypothetical protein